MKQQEKNLQTKQRLAASLKKLMNQKPLSKITVTDIVNDCDINRKTFYYHFDDIYGLLAWMLESEAVEVVKQFDLMVDYEEAITFVMDYVENNTHILNCAYDAMGRERIKRFFFADFLGIARTLVQSVERTLGLYLEEDYRQFLCVFCTEAVAGMLAEWMQHRDLREREVTTKALITTMRATIEGTVRTAGKPVQAKEVPTSFDIAAEKCDGL